MTVIEVSVAEVLTVEILVVEVPVADVLVVQVPAVKGYVPCVSRIAAFIIKNIDMIILFACLDGWLNSLPV